MTHRPWIPRLLALGAVLLLLGGAQAASAATPGGKQSAQAEAIAATVRDAMAKDQSCGPSSSRSPGATRLVRQAFGESMNGVPATTDMRFRNGAVAFAYLGTLLMLFVDEGKVTLDDTIDRWMPDTARGRQGHVEDAGQPDHRIPRLRDQPAWNTAFNADPFHVFTFDERLKIAFSGRCSSHPGQTGATPTPTS